MLLKKNRILLPYLRAYASLVFVAILALCTYTINLSDNAFVDYDEAAYAQVVSETVQSGNPLTFRFARQPWFDKPPFYFWAAMIAEKVLQPFSTIGMVDKDGISHQTEFVMRLPSALSGILCVMLVWLIVFERTRSKKIALVAALILLATGTFIDNVRQVRLDSSVTAAILFTYYSYLRTSSDPRWTIGVWSGLSVGVMIKSVIGLLAIPIIIIDFIIVNGHNDIVEKLTYFLSGYYTRIGLLISSILIIPWHLYQTVLFGKAFWNHYLFIHVIQRFDSNLFSTGITFFDFFSWFVGGALPWSVIFIISIVLCFIPSFFMDHTRYRLYLASTLSSVFIFSLFALSKTKAPSYLVPLYPFVAIAVALGAEAIRYHYFKEHHAKHTATLLTVTGSVVVVLIAFATATSIGFRQYEPLQAASVFAKEEQIIGHKIRPAPSTTPIYYTTKDKWETVRFYSNGKIISIFERENASSTLDYYIVAPRHHLSQTLNSPAIKFADDFTVEYLGNHLTLIKVENNKYLATTTKS